MSLRWHLAQLQLQLPALPAHIALWLLCCHVPHRRLQLRDELRLHRRALHALLRVRRARPWRSQHSPNGLGGVSTGGGSGTSVLSCGASHLRAVPVITPRAAPTISNRSSSSTGCCQPLALD